METEAPDPRLRFGFAHMTRDERAYAAWLAIRAGYPIRRATWGAVLGTGQVVVEVPRLGATWGVPFCGSETLLDLIEDRFGPVQRQQAEGAIG